MKYQRPSSGVTLVAVRWFLLAALCALGAGACSADSVAEPEATYDTAGAFVAVVGDSGDLELYRILATLGVHPYDPIFVVPYTATPASFAEARELAKDPTLPHRMAAAVARKYFTSHEQKVVWFRSISAEEQAEFR